MRSTRFEKCLWILIWGLTGIFALWPIGEVLLQSILQDGVLSLFGWEQLFTSQLNILTNSLKVASLVTLITIPLGSCIALFLARSRSRMRILVGGMLILSQLSPPFVGSMAFIMLFGRRGLITWNLLGLNWDPYGMTGIVLMESFALTTLATLLLTVTLKGIDRSLENASLDLGMSKTKTLLYVTLPLCLPGIAATSLLVFVRALSDFSTPLIVGGQFQVLASKAYMALIHMGDFQLSSAMSSLLLIPAVIAVWCMRKLGSGTTFSMRMADRQPGFALPGLVAAVASGAALLFTLAQILLYGLILWGSVSVTWGVNFSFTLDHLHALLDFRQSSILRSLGCAFTAACGGSLLGMVCAGLLRYTSPLRKQWAESLLTLPYILPGTFFGLGYLLAFSRLPFDISASVLIAFNCMFRQLAPSLKAGTAGVSSIDPALEKAVRDLGGGPSAYFKDVLIPLLRPSALFAFVNAFSASMISTGPIIFLVTPYAKVMSVDMFESINSGSFGEANAMAVALIGLVLAMEGIVFLIDRLWRRHARV